MFDGLLTFAVVVEQKSLNQAAKQLNLSQPALSRKIAGLEEELGVSLFVRAGKRLELTEIGNAMYGKALQLRELERQILRTVASHEPSEHTVVTIGASLTTLQSTLPDLLADWTAAFPRIEFKAITGKTHEIVERALNGSVDLGLVASLVQHPELICIPLFDDHLRLVLPEGHPLIRKKGLAIQDLDRLPMILFSKGTWYRILMDELFKRFRIEPEIQMEIDSFEAILRLASTCNAATLLPHSYLRSSMIEDNRLSVVGLAELQQAVRTTSIVYRKHESPIAVHDIAEAAVQYYR